MDILIEIQKEEMEVQNLVKDWHVQKLESFIEDLIEKDRAEQLRLHNVSNQRELLLKEMSDWLMTQTKIPVEKIVDFTEHFKQ